MLLFSWVLMSHLTNKPACFLKPCQISCLLHFGTSLLPRQEHRQLHQQHQQQRQRQQQGITLAPLRERVVATAVPAGIGMGSARFARARRSSSRVLPPKGFPTRGGILPSGRLLFTADVQMMYVSCVVLFSNSSSIVESTKPVPRGSRRRIKENEYTRRFFCALINHTDARVFDRCDCHVLEHGIQWWLFRSATTTLHRRSCTSLSPPDATIALAST